MQPYTVRSESSATGGVKKEETTHVRYIFNTVIFVTKTILSL